MVTLCTLGVGDLVMNVNACNVKSSVELFSGAGGLALATQKAGFHHIGLYEWNQDACNTLVENSLRISVTGVDSWANIVNAGDVSVRDFTKFENIDLVAGGPPCQPFSLGGKHRGMEDKRDMIPQFIRAVREAKPRAFLMENVKGLTRNSFSAYLNYSLLQLAYPEILRKNDQSWEEHLLVLEKVHTSKKKTSSLRYNVLYRVLNAADYGIAQTRERLFVVGIRSDINANWSFPEPTHAYQKLFFEQNITNEYWERTGREKKINTFNKYKLKDLEKYNVYKPWKTLFEAISDLPAPFVNYEHDGKILNHKFQPGAKPYPGHTGSVLDLPAKTLKAGAHGVPGGENMINFENGKYRYLTVREAARVQTFPDTWKFSGAWGEAMRQIGNAVPVDLASCVANSLFNIN